MGALAKLGKTEALLGHYLEALLGNSSCNTVGTLGKLGQSGNMIWKHYLDKLTKLGKLTMHAQTPPQGKLAMQT